LLSLPEKKITKVCDNNYKIVFQVVGHVTLLMSVMILAEAQAIT
jgi:hypothetical protein